MRWTIVALLVLLLPCGSSAQQMIKVNMVELYDKVPPPPVDAKEAFARCEKVGEDNPTNCSPEKFYQPIVGKAQELTKQLEETSMKLVEPDKGSLTKANAEEIQKKMETMSQEEKVKYAMELSNQMGLGQRKVVVEPPSVTAFMQEYSKVSLETGKDMQKIGEESRKDQQMGEDRWNKHKDIDEWTRKEMDKIPEISTGEMSYREPKAEHALLLKSAEKHIALENEYLKWRRKQFQTELDKDKKRYISLQQKVAATGYGEEAKNLETKRMVISAQGILLGPVEGLTGMSRDATKEAADWYAKKLELEKQKPQ